MFVSLKGKSTAFFFLFFFASALIFSIHTRLSFTGTRVNCCLTCAVTLPNAICISPSQIHYYTIPLVGIRFCYVSTQATDSQREIHKPCVGGRNEGGGGAWGFGLHQCLLICKKRSDLQSLYERVFDGALLLCQCSTCCRHWHPLLPSRSLARLSGRRASSPTTRPWFTAGSVTRYHSKWVGKTSLVWRACKIVMISFVIPDLDCCCHRREPGRERCGSEQGISLPLHLHLPSLALPPPGGGHPS